MLAIRTPATSSALTTRANLRARYAGLAAVSDAQLDALIAEASGRIAGHCARTFGATQVRQTSRAVCAHGLLLEAPAPFASFDSVTMDGGALVEGTDFECDGPTLHRLSADKRVAWSAGKVVIDYTVGWTLPGAPTPTLPAPVEAACIELVWRAAQALRRDQTLKAETIVGVAKFEYDSFGGAAAGGALYGLAPDIAGMLSPFVVRILA